MEESMKSFETSSRIIVAHVLQNLNIGGLEKIVIALATGVDSERFQSEVYCLEDRGPLLDDLRGASVRVEAMNKKRGLAYVLPLRMARVFRKHRVDIVHCHNFGALVYGGVAGRIARVSGIVYTAHGPRMPSGRLQVMFQRGLAVDRVITVSEYLRRNAVDELGFHPVKVRTIVNGIDTERFCNGIAENIRGGMGIDDAGSVFCVVARLTKEKNHEMLFEAFASVVRDTPGVKLLVVGDGELSGALRGKAATLGLENDIVFMGNRMDVPRMLQASDIFVMCSREEGFGITLLEAMAARLPVVATGVGGIPEVVVHGETGLIVPSGDAVRFAEAMKWMLDHPREAREMGIRGKARVTSHFSVQEMVQRYEAVYSDILA